MHKILKNIIEMDDYSVQKLGKSQPPEPFEWNTVEGTELNVDDCIGGKGKITVKGNTEQASRILPEGYTQVDYIESHGEEYIDTGVNADSNLRVVIDMQYTDISTDNSTNFGAITDVPNIRYHFMCQIAAFRFYTNNEGITLINKDTNRHLFDLNVPNNKVIIDSKEFEKISTPFNTNLNFWLFGRNSNSSNLIFYNKSKLYKSKMYVSEVLVRDYVPCYRNSDNVLGLFDLVNDVFYTNDGTGAFTYGSVVNIPNPDYPQEIRVVTGDNNIVQCGKNVIPTNISEWEQGTINSSTGKTESSTSRIRTADFVKVKAMTDYYISTNNDNTYVILNILVYDKNKDFIANYYNIDKNISGTTGLKVAFPEGTAYIKVTVRKSDNSNLVPAEVEIAKPMLEQNTTATEFEPHIEKKYQLNLGNMELCKIGDYQDALFKNVVGDENYNAELESGAWYELEKINNILLDDNCSYSKGSTRTSGFSRWYTTPLEKALKNDDAYAISQIYANKLIGISMSKSYAMVDGITYNTDNTGNLCFYLDATKRMTADQVAQYMKLNPIKVYYIKKEPTYTKITDTTLISQLEALRKAKWFKGVNHWWTETENLEPVLEGTYKQSLSGSEVP